MPGKLYQLSADSNDFPPAHLALTEPDGLLAIGGDLSVERLYAAYQQGIFPWFSDAEPLMWWSPATRATLCPTDVHIGKSMAKFIRQTPFTVSINSAFSDVIHACALPRKTQQDTWINTDMISAYIALHKAGIAHSIEVWSNDELVGGLYGVNIGGIFCGESMFHFQTNASKLAFVTLCQQFSKMGGQLIDCQMMTTHLQSLGVKPCTRAYFLQQLAMHKSATLSTNGWAQQTVSFCK